MSPAPLLATHATRALLRTLVPFVSIVTIQTKMVDALQRPFLRISPEFGTYAEEHRVFELFEAMLKELLISRPDNPLEFLVKLLSKPIIDGMS